MNTPRVKRRGFMYVLSSPSGAGKTTLSKLLLADDTNLILSISATTRPKRPQEEDGIDYYFMDKESFLEQVKAGEFLEYAEVFGHYYGTPRKKVEEALNRGCDVLFDIDWQGTHQLAEKAREDLVSVFILPPSMQELERRLRSRGQDSDDVIQGRMAKAEHEISHWEEYDYVMVNYSIEGSMQKVTSILRAERLRRVRQHGLDALVKELLAE